MLGVDPLEEEPALVYDPALSCLSLKFLRILLGTYWLRLAVMVTALVDLCWGSAGSDRSTVKDVAVSPAAFCAGAW